MSNAPDRELEQSNPEALASLRRMQALHAARLAAGDAEPTEPRPLAKIIQLPLWPEPLRGMPNPALRSALFSAIQSKDRRFIDHELIAAVDGVEIRFLGKQLNQEDLEVCAQVFHLARLHPLGDVCHTSAYGLLKSLGLCTGRTNHRQLHASLIRLQQPFEMKVGPRYSYSGSFLMKGIKDELTRHYLIRVNPDLAPLFHNGWTALDVEQRRTLRGKPLALWLHAFYASHDKPYPYKVQTLRELCGSRTTELYKFRQNLRHALGDLQTTGAVAAWEIEAATDLVHVHKVPTITCRRAKPSKSMK